MPALMRVKLCGMTRPDDVAAAVALGADYVGVIFAGGPRMLTVPRAREVLEPARGRVAAVGVFGSGSAARIGQMARAAGVDVVQLHGDPAAADVDAMRSEFAGPVWAAYRMGGTMVGAGGQALFAVADAVVLDARDADVLGGSGKRLPWAELGPAISPLRAGRAALVLAGGLDASNVEEAVRLLKPDVVDVSSGIESAPGIKDHGRMRAYVDAAHAAALVLETT